MPFHKITILFNIFLYLITSCYCKSARSIFQEPNNTIVLVPGIGGSVLLNNKSRVWITFFNQDNNAKKLASKYSYSDNKYQDDITIDRSRFGLNGIYNLNPDILVHSMTAYFQYLIDHLINIGYEPGLNLFGYPYDWRYSNGHPEILSQFHEFLEKLSTNRKVTLISHSMGGIFIENYIRKHGPFTIANWYVIASPLKGAAGNVLNSFTVGYNLGNARLSNSLAKNLTYHMFSPYELLPQRTLFKEYPKRPTISVLATNSTTDYYEYLTSIPEFNASLLIDRDCFKIDTDSVYIGTSKKPTPYSITITNGGTTSSKIEGDGSVPIISALHSHCHFRPTYTDVDTLVDTDHVDLIRNIYIISFLDKLNGVLCMPIGLYKNYYGTLNVTSPVVYLSSSASVFLAEPFEDYYIDTSCLVITNYKTKRSFNRIIGNECSYSLYKPLLINGKLIYCIYGYKYNNMVVDDILNSSNRYKFIDVDRPFVVNDVKCSKGYHLNKDFLCVK